jgi:hypothetical protein
MVNYKNFRKILAENTPEVVFRFIYRQNLWGNKESVSGIGSGSKQTRIIVKEIPKLIKKHRIKSILDIPCGDFNWMRNVVTDDLIYIGGDIVETIVKKNQRQYKRDNIKFIKINLIEDPLPAADLLICRDCFVHFSYEDIKKSLSNIRKSKIRYLLLTTYTERTRNRNILTGDWRPLNMEIKPFYLQPIQIINERCTERKKNRRYTDKNLMLVRVSTIKNV